MYQTRIKTFGALTRDEVEEQINQFLEIGGHRLIHVEFTTTRDLWNEGLIIYEIDKETRR